MTHQNLYVFGLLGVGHQFSEHQPFQTIQRTVLVKTEDEQITYRHAELTVVSQVMDIANDENFAKVINDDLEPRVMEHAIAGVQKVALFELDKSYDALRRQMDDLTEFLSRIGHTVHKAPGIGFMNREDESKDRSISKKEDLRPAGLGFFSDDNVRMWLADQVARADR